MESTRQGSEVPQKSHDHSEQEIYIGILLHHAFSFGHQGHGHQNREPALYLPEKLYHTSINASQNLQ